MQYKTIDLCAGIGGIRRGFEITERYKNVCSAEIDEFACKTYEHLFSENPRNDITSADFKNKVKNTPYDVLLAGFPCQSFSSVGLRKGFEDKTKGTIFFEIKEIIKDTHPKVIFLENVQNLVIHDKGQTFKTIIEALETELDYHVIGVTRDKEGKISYKPSSFIRNSKYFGIPQNRPRVFIVAFSRMHFGNYLSCLPDKLPEKSDKTIFESVTDVLDRDVEERYFLSSGYLKTLEDHIDRQKSKGYGFGYRIVNTPGVEKPIASTLLATGGSGRERNLIYDEVNGRKHAGKNVKGKYSPVNSKNIRTMTPTEWGKLQGFIGYAFMNGKIDTFSFPDGIPNVQKYKQFGNSVTIPVIETMARFIAEQMDTMFGEMDETSRRLQMMCGNNYLVSRKIYLYHGSSMRKETINRMFDFVEQYSDRKEIHTSDVSNFFGVTSARGSQIVKQLCCCDCLKKSTGRGYVFLP